MRVLIVGCGDIGCRVGLDLAAEGHQVTGIRRDVGQLPAAITPLALDVFDADGLSALSTTPYDIVVYILSASSYDEAAYQRAYVDGLRNVLTAMAPIRDTVKRLIFVSSTGVYHQDDHSWVDERSPTRPARFNGQLMLKGEQLTADTGIGTVVRFSGIYGPSRLRLIQRVRNKGVTPAEPRRFTNRIHIDDCVGVLCHLIRAVDHGDNLAPIYLASDCEPATAHDVETFIARQLGIDPTINAASIDASSRGAGSKRCRNRLLLDSGYRFRVPSYREGYAGIIAAVETQ